MFLAGEGWRDITGRDACGAATPATIELDAIRAHARAPLLPLDAIRR